MNKMTKKFGAIMMTGALLAAIGFAGGASADKQETASAGGGGAVIQAKKVEAL
ncbi:hypothetical protein ACFYKX_10845 [Cytobacillus sp. FJAT-54145]|uniref:Uncharacterized protein n=1 Tax=Cytobacillus spartinae TaxID=3299023 RepID=A0ABW6KBY5_9BACI